MMMAHTVRFHKMCYMNIQTDMAVQLIMAQTIEFHKKYYYIDIHFNPKHKHDA